MATEQQAQPQTQTAYAKSAWLDPQFIATFLTGLLALLTDPDLLALIPLRYMPKIVVVTTIVLIILRRVKGTNPVRFIPPGEVKPVEVPKLTATQVGSETNRNATR